MEPSNKPHQRSQIISRNRPPPLATFAFRVESYDLTKTPNVARGKRIGNDQQVEVYLQSPKDIGFTQGANARAEIKDFAAKRKHNQHPGTEVGGVLLVQNAIDHENGIYGARWLQSLSHTADEAEVFIACVHVTPVRKGTGDKPYSVMTVLHDGLFENMSQDVATALRLTEPFRVENTKDLEEAVTSLLADKVGVGIRFSTADTFDAMFVSKKREQSDEEAVSKFMASISDLHEQVNSGELTCEVVPYGSVFAGPKTVDIMAKNKRVAATIPRFNEPAQDRQGNPYDKPIFRPAIVAVRLTDADADNKRAVFFTHFEPLYSRQPVQGLVNAIAYAQTEVLRPEPPRPDAAAAPTASGNANGAGQPDAGPDSSFDASSEAGGHGHIDQSDVVGALETGGSFDIDGAVDGPVDSLADTPEVEQPTPAAETPVQEQARPATRRYGGRRAA
jgi:hypothetical protein